MTKPVFVDPENMFPYLSELPQLTTDGQVTLQVALLQTEEVTVAELTSPPPHYSSARGTAKKHPHDKNNPVIGTSLAVARALRVYADTLEAAAIEKSLS